MLHLLEQLPSIGRALVMVQAEVADRMAARPGSKIYGVPSVKLAWYGSAGGRGRCPGPCSGQRRTWTPRWSPSPAGRTAGPATSLAGPVVSREEVFAVIDAAFAQRRKTLRSALAAWAGSPQAAETVLREAGVDPSLRGEAIGIEQYIRIVLAARKARTIIES